MRLSDIFSNYFTVRAELVAALEGLPPEQWAWKAAGHPNSIAWLAVHIAETEYWWITDVALGRADKARYDTFTADLPPDSILSLLEEMHGEVRRYLEEEPLDDWDTVFYRIPGEAEKVSKRWLIWHVVEHQARHRGQIFMPMHIQGLEVPHV